MSQKARLNRLIALVDAGVITEKEMKESRARMEHAED